MGYLKLTSKELEGELLKLKRNKTMRKRNLIFILSLIILVLIIICVAIRIGAHNWIIKDNSTDFKQKNINVKSFGAKGDGVTNDTIVIQKAIDSTNQKNIKVLFPKGNYVVDFLKIPGNVDIEGEKGANIVASKKRYSSFISISGKNVELRGIKINGEDRRSIGLRIMRNSKNIKVYECSINNMDSTYPETTAGIRIEGKTKDILIKNNIIDSISNSPNGIQGDNPGTSRGILISRVSQEIEPSNLQILKNVIRNIQTREDGDGIAIQGWRKNVHVIISDNFFDSCAKRAIKIMSPGVLIKNNKIVNNYIHNTDYTKVMYSFISIYASDVVVSGNHMIGGNAYTGIDIGTDLLETPKRIKVTNNEIVFSDIGIKTFIAGISMHTSARDIYLSGNIIKNVNYGIQIRKQLTGCIITSNSIINASERGIYINNFDYIGISKVIISNNDIYSLKEAILLKAGEVVVSGNTGKTSSRNWSFITSTNGVDEIAQRDSINNLSYLPEASEFYRGIVITLKDSKAIDISYICTLNANKKTYHWEKLKKSKVL